MTEFTGPTMNDDAKLALQLERIATALERLAGPPPEPIDLEAASAFVWSAENERFEPVHKVNRVPLALLKGVGNVAPQLIANTEQFARGLPANNALLWGARGMGKSSLVKAVHADVRERLASDPAKSGDLKLVEIHREDIDSLPRCLAAMRSGPHRFIVFCDDLSFDHDDTSYKSLKAVLEGGVEGRPENVIFYATSNRRHLMPRDMMENERSTAINPSEAVEEKVSLSDRFGLWLGFHNCGQDAYLDMVRGYARHFGLGVPDDELVRDALEWSITRGGRSGRVAWQFTQHVAGRLGKHLDV
ncbi:ATP-dependent protease subunit [Hyphomicrobium sulfonivorans]|uniref:ATP-dependent protease subunit n=1 Tax=Hyphomicrobium sulfonivorans TaxID=121290 RepID=A0A120CXW0_HYPSL|nr:ATP-dependent protease subunit [Hyphomicrobium sulfonivorans]